MTRIRFKSDAFRREVSIINYDHSPDEWSLEAVGMERVTFPADTAGDAVNRALSLIPTMRKDRAYQAPARQRPNPVWLHAGKQPVPNTQSEVDQATKTLTEPQPADKSAKPSAKSTK